MNLEREKLIGLTAIPFFLILTAVLFVLDNRTVIDPPLLQPVLTTIILGLIPVFIAVVLFRSFLQGGSGSVLFLGAGMLVTGLFSIAGALLAGLSDGPNLGVTLFNTGVCISAVLTAIGVLTYFLMPGNGRATGNIRIASLTCGAIVAFVALFTIAALTHLVPPFFIQGAGPTELRQVILSTAIEFYGLAAILFLVLYGKYREDFHFWFALGLALFAIGLFSVALQPAVGSPLGWAGRSAEYLGMLLVLLSVIVLRHDAKKMGIPFPDMLSGFFGAENTGPVLLQRLNTLISSMRVGILLVWEDQIELANKTFCEYFEIPETPGDLLGLTQAEMLEKIRESYVHPEEEINHIKDIVRGKKAVIGEEVYMTKGRVFIRDFVPIFVNGTMHGRLWYHLDITGRKRAEERLRESEDRFRTLYSSMTEGVAIHEIVSDITGKPADYRILDVNPAFAAITGIGREQAVGALATALYGTVEPPYLPVYARVAESGAAEEFETEFVPMQKSFHISVFSPAKGRFATVFSDITERRKAEEALQKAHDELELRVQERTTELSRAISAIGTERHRLYDVLDTLPIYVCLLDKTYRMPFANKYFKETFGYSDTRCCHDFLFSLEKPCDTCETYTVMKTKAPHHWYWTGPNGKNYDIYDFPFYDSDGSFLILEMGIDITEQKKAEDALRTAHALLEERVRERTKELAAKNEDLSEAFEEIASTQEELRQNIDELRKREKDLSEAVVEKEILLSEIHHRVKNNLTAFISLLSLEGTYEDTPDGRRLKNDLQNRARSMALVHETLYRTNKFSSIDMDFYLTTLIEQITNSYSSTRHIRKSIEAEGVTIDIARATPCGLIVNEIITNSLKYGFPESFNCTAERGTPCTIYVGLTKEDDRYVLMVGDNGIGLPEGIDISTTRSLGLKLVHFLAKHQLRAQIDISREEGTKYTFRFS